MLTRKRIPLNPVLSEEWQNHWDRLMDDTWLRRKLNRDRRLREHYEYIDEHLPAFDSLLPGVVVDVGPGAGELMEIARAHGHEAIGIDAPDGAGGMGDLYLTASKLIHQRQNLTVFYERFENWEPVGADDDVSYDGHCVLCNFRGSIEQVMSEYMKGRPHDKHHLARELTWRQDQDTDAAFWRVMRKCSRLLREDGVLLIHANGTSSAESDQWYADTLILNARKCGLKLLKASHDLLHSFVKDVNFDDALSKSAAVALDQPQLAHSLEP